MSYSLAPAATVTMSPTPTTMLKPSKSAAEVRIAPVSVTSEVAVNPSGRAGYRLKGPPEGADVDTDTEDDTNPLDVDGMSKSLAQRKLQELAGLSRKRPQQHAAQSGLASHKESAREQQPPRQPYPSPEAAPFVANNNRPQDYHRHQSVELMRTPSMPLPHPYNLPAPAPLQSPRTTRRQMMANEMSESLRRNLLWERTLTRRMLGGGLTRINPVEPATNERASGSNSNQHASRSDVRGPPAPLSRTKSWADDYHTSGW